MYRSATGFPYQLKPAVNEFLHKNRVSKADFLHFFGVRGKKISPGGDKSAIKIGDKLMKQEAKKQFITCL